MSLVPSAETRIPLGKSGLAVAPLGWGMWRFGGGDRASARRRVEAALEVGCTLFDTADIYGSGGERGFGGGQALLGGGLREAPQLPGRLGLAAKAGLTPPGPFDSRERRPPQAAQASPRRPRVEATVRYPIH